MAKWEYNLTPKSKPKHPCPLCLSYEVILAYRHLEEEEVTEHRYECDNAMGCYYTVASLARYSIKDALDSWDTCFEMSQRARRKNCKINFRKSLGKPNVRT